VAARRGSSLQQAHHHLPQSPCGFQKLRVHAMTEKGGLALEDRAGEGLCRHLNEWRAAKTGCTSTGRNS
jgi:hypothetical protein